MMKKVTDSLQAKKIYKIEGGALNRFEVALFNWLRATQRFWLWLEGFTTPLIIKLFAARGIDFELVRRFDEEAFEQEKLILKLVDAFKDAKEIYMALGEMGHGLMERSDVLAAFDHAKREHGATIQILHGPRVDPKTSDIFGLASNNVVELFRTPTYYRRHFSYVKNVDGRVTIFDEGIHDETIWARDEDQETIPLFTSLARHQYFVPDSKRLKDFLKNEFEYRKSKAEKVFSRPEKFIPSDYSALRIFLTSTFENLPRRHFIQPLENYFDMPLGIIRQSTRKNAGVEMNEKIKWVGKLTFKHYAWLLVFTFMAFFGLVDLIYYFLSGQTILHWLNDLLLIFGAITLVITIIMVVMDEKYG